MDKHQIKDLLRKYAAGTCTEQERAMLETWYVKWKPNDQVELSGRLIEDSVDKIWQRLENSNKSARKLWPGQSIRMTGVAAAILVFISIGIGFYTVNYKDQPARVADKITEPDITPGGDKATLTLADGRKISLTDVSNGQIAEESGIKITKAADGQIVYEIASLSPSGGDGGGYNTIETPLGGQFQIKLPDGTNVWLNSASSLKYPVKFSGKRRLVELSGEAYFEVFHSPQVPFRVVNANQAIEVLGTHFNVMSYPDEKSVRTTLYQGSVKVSTINSFVVLSPGQQSSITSASINVDEKPDLKGVIAWKNGKIEFSDMDIESIMRILHRWYNIEVTYLGLPVNNSFGGSVSKSKNLDEVLKVLEATGDVHFKVEGRRVFVMP
ncbi:MAG: FecR domain-containing protein [Daejeonella sp.]